MANDILGIVWSIDTAATLATKVPVSILGFLFKPAAASDQVVVKDDSGKIILDLKANATTAELQIPFLFGRAITFQGINVTTITSGAKLYLYNASNI